VGFATTAVYLFWNVGWLSLGRPAPSLFTGLTGLPCPTTGGTRSLHALLAGDLTGSFTYNPMTVPILGLLTATLAVLTSRALRRQRLSLPTGYLYAWFGLLSAAWLIKLCSPVSTW